jgi:hypothetical protein
MPRLDYKRCRECGRGSDATGPLSHTRLCRDCSIAREHENAVSLSLHAGEPFQRWRVRVAASVGAIPLDLLDTYLATREHRS